MGLSGMRDYRVVWMVASHLMISQHDFVLPVLAARSQSWSDAVARSTNQLTPKVLRILSIRSCGSPHGQTSPYMHTGLVNARAFTSKVGIQNFKKHVTFQELLAHICFQLGHLPINPCALRPLCGAWKKKQELLVFPWGQLQPSKYGGPFVFWKAWPSPKPLACHHSCFFSLGLLVLFVFWLGVLPSSFKSLLRFLDRKAVGNDGPMTASWRLIGFSQKL